MSIPERYYVFYRNKKEFNIINNHFKKNYRYIPQDKKLTFGYFSDLENDWNNWISSTIDLNTIQKLGYKEISFDDFMKYIIDNLNLHF